MMKKLLFTMAMAMVAAAVFAQTNNFWRKTTELPLDKLLTNARTTSQAEQLFDLDVSALTAELEKAPARGSSSRKSDIILSFPDAQGNIGRFAVIEASVLHPDLAAKYPGIKSYAGQGIDDPTATIRFSLAAGVGFHGMVLSGEKNTYYIDPYSADRKIYTVYARKDLADRLNDFQCLTAMAERPSAQTQDEGFSRTDDKKLRRYRLALSCNAEYGNIFAGTGTDAQKKANILAQMNITMTRVNGVFERDLAITMQLVPNNDLLIFFGSTSADPWSGEFNNKTQEVNDATIGNANYDIGHNFNTSGGGNAGCIGCVCVTGSKGSGFTGRPDPTGDAFDIDYVAHEMGHQYGGFHTQSSSLCISGSGLTEVEPGSGSTIMSYAGICTPNVQANSDAYFHYVNIRDISLNVQSGASSSCAQIINLTNNPPTANAGPNFTIPKSTAFVLKGQGSDPDGDAITFTWEQNDPQSEGTATSVPPTPTKTTGPMFRSKVGTSSPDRFFPQISDVVNNNLAPTWEVIPSVARTLNFALTVRDNKAGGGQTWDDLMVVTVNGTAGPFTVSAPNTAISWNAGSSQTVTWNVAGTNVAPVSCLNVNILLSTDGGFTYPVTLVSNTPNDGTQSITVPNNAATTCRIKVEAADNIFYDISNVNFSIITPVPCVPTVPTGLAAVNIAATGTTVTWNVVSGAASYDVQYRAVGAPTWISVSSSTNTVTVSGLTPSTQYEVQVRSVCPVGGSSAFSASVLFTTLAPPLAYCASKGNSVADEFIGRVQLGTINNNSGANAGYGNFTTLSTDLAKGTSNTITITPTWPGTVFNEGYAVWIDYNKDGDFADSGELVYSKAASKTTPVVGTFTIPSTASLGSTRMRVSMKYNAIPAACGNFSFGEVEDYTVNIITGGSSCTNVTLTLVLDNYPEETSWNIKNGSSVTVASGGTYGSSPDGSTITAVNCLAAGCYTFTILDSFGDGICCSFGSGSYVLRDAGGATLVSGGTFGSSQTQSFCIAAAAKTERGGELAFEERNVLHYYPNPVRDVLNIQVPENVTVKAVSVSSSSGIVVKDVRSQVKEMNVSSLSSGLYLLSIETNEGMIREKFIKE